MKRRTFLQNCAASALIPLTGQTASATALEEAFRRPPVSARPKTWWHWMNGNITAGGITRDLEAMQRAGVGGVQIFQVGTGIPKGPVDYGSPEHLQLLRHAAKEADRLGLEFVMANCPGWSSSGGPWITPELSMQQLVWSEAFVTGGQSVNIALPQPYTKHGYYRDAFVVAFPSLAGEERSMRDRLRNVTSGKGPVDVKRLTDADLSTAVDVVPAGSGGPAYLLLEFAEPFEARSISVYAVAARGARAPANPLALESSDDGVKFRRVAALSKAAGRAGSIEVPVTANFPAVRAKYFRLVSRQPGRIAQIELSGAARITDWVRKTNLTGPSRQPPGATENVPPGSVITSVLDITQLMGPDGRLNWQAPAGNWTILRFGHTSIGIRNHPAPDGGGGLECDKYSREAMDFHFNHFFGELFAALGPLAAKGMAGSLIDSYEIGMQTWTPKLPEEFQRRRGYDLRKYLPALTGRVVASGDASDRFLWDIRRTHADLMADNYYGRFAELCRAHGMKAYAEPYSDGPFDYMQAGSRLDVPMGEFWLGRSTRANQSIKLAASIGHLYGRPVVGAESYTGNPMFAKWQESPYGLKAQGDWMYIQGLNQFIFHRYAHHAHPDAAPGMTMGKWGLHFERTNTWWNQSEAWLEYAARCQSMLRQGLFVADLLYFEGENAPKESPSLADLSPEPPPGYDWDTADRQAILTRIKIENGRIVLPDGMSYRVLILLSDGNGMTVEVLRKIRDLVSQGMCLVGARPERTPSLSGFPDSEAEFRRIAAELWGDTATDRTFGKGRVFLDQPLGPVLKKLNVRPDFDFSARSGDAPVNYIHRRVGESEVYFLANRRRRSEDLVCSFRVEGKRPEFWKPDTGEIIPAEIYDVVDGATRVPVRLDPAGSVFVVFRSPAPARRLVSVAKDGAAAVESAPFPAPRAGLHRGVTNDFTISVWAKPDTDMNMPGLDPAESTSGIPASYVIYPPAGEVGYGARHAACGLLVGRNGVCVGERAQDAPSAVFTVPMPVAGWTHFALVYKGGVPSLYVDGKLARQGKKSASIVHPGLGEAYQRDDAWYFAGDMSDPELFAEALAEDRIRKLATGGLPAPEEPPAIELAGGGLLFWRDGSYSLRDSAGRSSPVPISGIGRPLEIRGPWRVSFPPNLGAPAEIVLPELMSLHRHSQEGVKYFSGTATYTKRINVAMHASKRLYLELGRVEVVAEVRLNGKDLGILWKPPYRLDITEAVHPGDNDLEIRVTNLWVNRLIGDEHLPPENKYGAGGQILQLPAWYTQGKPKPAGGRVTFATWKHYDKESPLVESGLLGPVLLRTAVQRALER